ncbi:hypothetical protein PIB30_002632 [Stylosanthes scabra]|uniref:DUF4283 domain-containing protein n=1 Tax=Stylosanthes scabra TaxID=79078 RepID=A0ABU6Q2U7_9FABA|nr:hypothetical protein [Stylosanthes scabra]
MYGMPLQAWSTENFNRIAEVWGTIISLDDHSTMGDSYNSVRAVLDTTWLSPINDIVHLVLNGTSYNVFVREIPMTFDEVQVNHIGEDGRNRIDVQEEETCNKQEDSVSTRCLFDDRCSEEVIKKTQLKVREDSIERASLHDTAKGVAKNNIERKSNDVRNQAQTGRDLTTKSKREKVCIHNKKEDDTEDFEDDIEESFTRDDEGNEDLEEAKNTLQVCEKRWHYFQ